MGDADGGVHRGESVEGSGPTGAEAKRHNRHSQRARRGGRPIRGLRYSALFHLASVCLFLVITTVLLGLQVFSPFGAPLTAVLILLAALFA